MSTAGKIIHLVSKDAVHAWPQIAIFLALLTAYAATDSTYMHLGRRGESPIILMLPALLSLSFWIVVVLAIHGETLIGTEQYWLTRPFSWKTVLAAKILFVVVFVNLPILVYQMAVLAYVGFPPLEYISTLLWKQVFFSIFMILPVAALAAVTDSFKQTIAVAAGLFLLPGLLGLRDSENWGMLNWILLSAAAIIVLAGAFTVLIAQYARRWTAFSRVVVGVGVVTVALVLDAPPWGPAYTIQTWFSKQHIDDQAARISFDQAKTAPRGSLNIPFRVDNLPPGDHLIVDWLSADIDAPGIARMSTGWNVSPPYGNDWLTIPLAPNKLKLIKGRPVHLHVSLGLTLSQQTGARCGRYCVTGADGYSPYPVSPWIAPVVSYEKPPGLILQQVAHIRRSFDADMD